MNGVTLADAIERGLVTDVTFASDRNAVSYRWVEDGKLCSVWLDEGEDLLAYAVRGWIVS